MSRESELTECMVRRLTAREKLRVKKVCVNVSGLFVEIVSPGHDEIRRVPVLQNASAV
jgi:hypothetical protein